MTRFRETDPYRARREWLRYEGTPQRDLYRELRERFLVRHATDGEWVLDLGSGPGRFLPWIGGPRSRRVALDVSREMLGLVPGAWAAAGSPGPVPDRVVGVAGRSPLRTGRWSEVVLLGNTLGFAGRDADRVLDEALRLVGREGTVVVEAAPSSGEHSAYLARLPPSAVARLLRSPLRAVAARVEREGYRPEPMRHATPATFRRFSARELQARLVSEGWEVRETIAIAPALGSDPERITAVRNDPKAWERLLELEEEVGRRPGRWPGAAALLVAARHASSMRMIK